MIKEFKKNNELLTISCEANWFASSNLVSCQTDSDVVTDKENTTESVIFVQVQLKNKHDVVSKVTMFCMWHLHHHCKIHRLHVKLVFNLQEEK